MFDDVNFKGFGLPYLGIKPTAAGVAPVMPIPHIPSLSEIPAMAPPVKAPTSQNPAHVASPMPFSQPKAPAVSQPIKTTQAPMSSAQVPQQNPAQFRPAAPQINGPMYPPLNQSMMKNIPMGDIQNGYHDEQDMSQFPQSLQPQPVAPEQKRPAFNQLTNLLNKR